MEKTTLKDIKATVRMKLATDITSYGEKERKALLEKEGRLEKVSMSFGMYGMTGALLQGYNTGTLYAITARNSTLFTFC